MHCGIHRIPRLLAIQVLYVVVAPAFPYDLEYSTDLATRITCCPRYHDVARRDSPVLQTFSFYIIASSPYPADVPRVGNQRWSICPGEVRGWRHLAEVGGSYLNPSKTLTLYICPYLLRSSGIRVIQVGHLADTNGTNPCPLPQVHIVWSTSMEHTSIIPYSLREISLGYGRNMAEKDAPRHCHSSYGIAKSHVPMSFLFLHLNLT